MERMERVPSRAPWDTKIQIANAQREEARTNSEQQTRRWSTAPAQAQAPSKAQECAALDENIRQLDAAGRQGSTMYSLDNIRERRRNARNRQFQIRC